jgi:hypothetical protein
MPQKNSEKMALYYKGLQKHKRKKVTTQDDDTCLKISYLKTLIILPRMSDKWSIDEFWLA